MQTPTVTVKAVAKVILEDLSLLDSYARDLRRADDFIRLAVGAASKVIGEMGEEFSLPEETGLFVGTAFGPLETNFSSLGTLLDDGEGRMSPTLFSHSVFNAAAGYLGKILGIQGPALTLTTFAWPLLSAVNEARLAIAANRITCGLVVAVETYSTLMADAREQFGVKSKEELESGAVAWLLGLDSIEHRGLAALRDIRVEESSCAASQYLTREGESWQGDGLPPDSAVHPLSSAFALTDAVAKLYGTFGSEKQWSLEAPFGKAELLLG